MSLFSVTTNSAEREERRQLVAAVTGRCRIVATATIDRPGNRQTRARGDRRARLAGVSNRHDGKVLTCPPRALWQPVLPLGQVGF